MPRNWLAPPEAFCICGSVGIAVAMPVALLTAAHLGLSLQLTAETAIAGIATWLTAVIVAKILTGNERFVYLRSVSLVIAVMAAVVYAARQPVLPYLDCMTLGIGLLLAFGRIGCLLVGCCHGRPARWGIRYNFSHADCGFPYHYVGVRLVPVQAMESVFVFILVAIGIVIVWKGSEPGTVLAFYLAAYALGRFFMEFARGDAERPFFLNFSEAQGTSVLLLWAIVVAQHFQFLPNSNWHVLAALLLTICLLFFALVLRITPSHRFQLHHPHHVRELAQALHQLSQLASPAPGSKSAAAPPAGINLFTTSCGIQLSGGALRESTHNQNLHHYCLSASHTTLTKPEAQTLSTLIVRLLDLPRHAQLLERKPGIFHVFICYRELSNLAVEASRSPVKRYEAPKVVKNSSP
jgi:Prolipoprotein diacylglyceryl transferase